MFGTIGRVRLKPGHERQLRDLMQEWTRTMRPTVPGLVVQLGGHPVDRAGELVTVVLTQDEATYRALAASPEQDRWYRRLVEHLVAEPTWEDVAWDEVRFDAARGG